MDSDRQQLAAVEQEIKDLVKQQTRFQKKDRQGTITDEEEIELAGIDKLLAEAKDDKKYYRELIKLTMKDEPPESKSFSEADSEWIQAVTGVNTTYRKWTGYTIDVNIQPRPGFQTKFEEVERQASVTKTCGNVSQKPHRYTRLEWMLVRPKEVSGGFSRMQKPGSSFSSMKLDFCGEVVHLI